MSAHQYCPGHPGDPEPTGDAGDVRADECPKCQAEPGRVEATVQLLTTEQARAVAPELFSEDEDPYFNMMDATGNGQWVDCWPDLVMIVRNPKGDIVMTSNASDWHMKACGYEVPR